MDRGVASFSAVAEEPHQGREGILRETALRPPKVTGLMQSNRLWYPGAMTRGCIRKLSPPRQDKYENKTQFWYEEELVAEYEKEISKRRTEKAELEVEGNVVDTLHDHATAIEMGPGSIQANMGSIGGLMTYISSFHCFLERLKDLLWLVE